MSVLSLIFLLMCRDRDSTVRVQHHLSAADDGHQQEEAEQEEEEEGKAEVHIHFEPASGEGCRVHVDRSTHKPEICLFLSFPYICSLPS